MMRTLWTLIDGDAVKWTIHSIATLDSFSLLSLQYIIYLFFFFVCFGKLIMIPCTQRLGLTYLGTYILTMMIARTGEELWHGWTYDSDR